MFKLYLTRLTHFVVILLTIGAVTSALWIGMGKQININENTLYDAETGRSVYVGE